MTRVVQRLAVFVVAALFAGACGGGDDGPRDAGGIEDGGTQDAARDGASSDASTHDASGSDAAGDATVVVMGEPSALEGITDVHNAARAGATPTPSPALPTMTWSNTVGTAAQIVANRCLFQHSGNGYGENIYASYGGSGPSAEDVVSSWVSEADDYDYASNTCASGKECGHYTQVVWRTSTLLGCGIATCTTNSPFGNANPWYLVVCDYSPAGNVNVDENRPY